jgi:hypothetical protein
MGNGCRKLQIGDGQASGTTRGCNESGLDRRRERMAPDNGRVGGRHSIEPHTAHAETAGIAGADIGRRHWDELAKASGPVAQRVGKRAKVIDASKDMAI